MQQNIWATWGVPADEPTYTQHDDPGDVTDEPVLDVDLEQSGQINWTDVAGWTGS